MYSLLEHINTLNLFLHYLHVNASISSHLSNYLSKIIKTNIRTIDI